MGTPKPRILPWPVWQLDLRQPTLPDMAHLEGTSSLGHTLDLHISNSHLVSLTLNQYKAYLQDLVKDMDF
ncbi:hypothetical protein J1605_014607 [Eschrichtius robustus]|uniref:Uncharacterized protein n=1 Tax=Eschrichtius robustus TaxID=9764 RepID=A0AB34GBV7_ESCRO|nr:hypothetical protein J1605_014607 [Eschrichtius robustus]